MTWGPQNPKDALSKMDMLTKGADATRHGLLGFVVGHANGPPELQARNYLYSCFNGGQMTDDEYRHWSARLANWEAAGGVVNMPPRVGAADHPEQRSK